MKDGKFVSPARYRALVNAFASGIHSVDPNAIVIAGNTAPFGHRPEGRPSGRSPSSRESSRAKVQFDAWSTHPYTYGGPTHHADKRHGRLARRHGRAAQDPEQGQERGQDSRLAQAAALGVGVQLGLEGPDQRGVRMSLLSRWISETVYRLNKAGVSALLWFGDARPAVRRDPDAVGLLVLRYRRPLGRRQQRAETAPSNLATTSGSRSSTPSASRSSPTRERHR